MNIIKLGDYLEPKMTGEKVFDTFGAPLIEALIEKILEMQGPKNSKVASSNDQAESGDDSDDEKSDDGEDSVEEIKPELLKDFILLKVNKVREDLIKIFNDNEKIPLQKLISCFSLITEYLDRVGGSSLPSIISSPIITEVFTDAINKILNEIFQKAVVEITEKSSEQHALESFVSLKQQLQTVLQSLYVGPFLKTLKELKDKADAQKYLQEIINLEKELSILGEAEHGDEKSLDVNRPETYFDLASKIIHRTLEKFNNPAEFSSSSFDQVVLKEACQLQQAMLFSKDKSKAAIDKPLLFPYELSLYNLISELSDLLDKEPDKAKAIQYLFALKDLLSEPTEDKYIDFANDKIIEIRNIETAKLTNIDRAVLGYCEIILDLGLKSKQSEEQEEGKGKEKEKEKGKEKEKDEEIGEKTKAQQSREELNKVANKKFIDALESDLEKIKADLALEEIKEILPKIYEDLKDILTKAKDENVSDLDWCRKYAKILSEAVNDIEYKNREEELKKEKNNIKVTRDDNQYTNKAALLSHLEFLNNWLNDHTDPHHILLELNEDDNLPHRLVTPGKHQDTLSYIQLETNSQNAIYRLNKYKFNRNASFKLGLYEYVSPSKDGKKSTRGERISAAERVIGAFSEMPFDERRKERKIEESLYKQFTEILIDEKKEKAKKKEEDQEILTDEKKLFLFNLYVQTKEKLTTKDKEPTQQEIKEEFLSERKLFEEFSASLAENNLNLKLDDEEPKQGEEKLSASEALFAFNLYKQNQSTLRKEEAEDVKRNFLGDYELYKDRFSNLLKRDKALFFQIKNANDPQKLKLQTFNLYKEFYALENELILILDNGKGKRSLAEEAFAFNLYKQIKSELKGQNSKEIKVRFSQEYRLYKAFFNLVAIDEVLFSQIKKAEDPQRAKLQEFSLFKEFCYVVELIVKLKLDDGNGKEKEIGKKEAEVLFAFNLYKQIKLKNPKSEEAIPVFLRDWNLYEKFSNLVKDDLKLFLKDKKAADQQRLKLVAFNLYKEIVREQASLDLEEAPTSQTERIKEQFWLKFRELYQQVPVSENTDDAFPQTEKNARAKFLLKLDELDRASIANPYQQYRKGLMVLQEDIKNISDKSSKLRATFYTINNNTYRVLNQANTNNAVVSEALKISNNIYHQQVIEKLLSESASDEYVKDKTSLNFSDIFVLKIFGNKLAYKIQKSLGHFLKDRPFESFFVDKEKALTAQKEEEFVILTMLKNYLEAYNNIHDKKGNAVVEFYVGFLEICAIAQLENTDPAFREKLEESKQMILQRLEASSWLKLTPDQNLRKRKAMAILGSLASISAPMADSQKTERDRLKRSTDHDSLKKKTEVQVKVDTAEKAEEKFERIVRTKLNNYFYAQKVISTGKFSTNPPKEKEFTKLLSQAIQPAVTAAGAAAPMGGVPVAFARDLLVGKLDEQIDKGHNKERENAVLVVPEGGDADEIARETAKALTTMYLDPIRRVIADTEIEKFADCAVERVADALKNGIVKEEGEDNVTYSKRLAMETRNCAVNHKHWIFEMTIETQSGYAFGTTRRGQAEPNSTASNSVSKSVTVESIFSQSVPMNGEGYFESVNGKHKISSLYGCVMIEKPDPRLYKLCSNGKYDKVRNDDEHKKVIAKIDERQKQAPKNNKGSSGDASQVAPAENDRKWEKQKKINAQLLAENKQLKAERAAEKAEKEEEARQKAERKEEKAKYREEENARQMAKIVETLRAELAKEKLTFNNGTEGETKFEKSEGLEVIETREKDAKQSEKEIELKKKEMELKKKEMELTEKEMDLKEQELVWREKKVALKEERQNIGTGVFIEEATNGSLLTFSPAVPAGSAESKNTSNFTNEQAKQTVVSNSVMANQVAVLN